MTFIYFSMFTKITSMFIMRNKYIAVDLCDNKFFNSNSQCTRGHYKCFWCFTERIISY